MAAFSPKFSDYVRSAILLPWFLVILFVVMLIVVPVTILSFGKATNWMIKNLGYIIGASCLWVLNIKLNIRYSEGKKPEGPAVFLINHSSTLDLFVLLAIQMPNIRFVAKKEFQYNPLFFVLGNLTGQIFIDRSHTESAVRKLHNQLQRVKQKKLSVMFAPEGSRTHPGLIGPFKRGAFRMAIDLAYPIVPVYIENARNLCPGAAMLATSGTIDVTFHPAISTESWSHTTLAKHIKDTRDLYLDWAGVTEDISEAELAV